MIARSRIDWKLLSLAVLAASRSLHFMAQRLEILNPASNTNRNDAKHRKSETVPVDERKARDFIEISFIMWY